MIKRSFYSDCLARFIARTNDEILGKIALGGSFAIETTQRDAWTQQIQIVREALSPYRLEPGKVYFEFAVPRVGKRIDVLIVLREVLFVVEFKVGESRFKGSDRDQVLDYALDLKNFHETSHNRMVAPILVATRAHSGPIFVGTTEHADGLLLPICVGGSDLGRVLRDVLEYAPLRSSEPGDAEAWESGRYSPTPTIVEAALALYGGHAVEDISRSDAGATNLTRTSGAICEIIRAARRNQRKSICFVTGVPGAGKTLVGLDVATQHFDKASELYSVFLSGNGPLVDVLREALARDKVHREEEKGRKFKLGAARSEVKAFIQNVHHFRDDCLADSGPPIEHVALFDEAQRAWNVEKTSSFMRQKKGVPDFTKSEPEFLISCMDRHPDWAVVVCLVGGGQEINTGEAGIREWFEALLRTFPDWRVHLSPHLRDSEYDAGPVTKRIQNVAEVEFDDRLHLGVSMRSFRAERVSELVKAILDHEVEEARRLRFEVTERYPIVLTRDLRKAKLWLRGRARGSERYGVVVSSQAVRLKPYAIDIRSPMDPIHWFLGPKDDVRSSYYLEDVATEFQIQGLELDWVAVVWDGDLRCSDRQWQHYSFVGNRWNRVLKSDRQKYQKNAYRVLLTRARQGMVLVIPEGDEEDPTRSKEFYDPTYELLKSIGFPVL